MKRALVGLIALTLIACGPKHTPKHRYLQALNKKLEGNSKAYYDGMIALAHDEPEGEQAVALWASRRLAESCNQLVVRCKQQVAHGSHGAHARRGPPVCRRRRAASACLTQECRGG